MIKAVFLVSMMLFFREFLFKRKMQSAVVEELFLKNYNSYDSFYHKAFLNSHSKSLLARERSLAEVWAVLGQRREK